jgi:hypothetical protein
MELAQAGQLLGAFLGGGIGGAYLDHRWANRNARMAELRPIDRDRINVVRERSRLVYGGAVSEALRLAFHPDAPAEGEYRLFNWDEIAPVATQELADDHLHRLWRAFQGKAAVFPLEYRDAIGDGRQDLWSELRKSHSLVLRRLNELERSR